MSNQPSALRRRLARRQLCREGALGDRGHRQRVGFGIQHDGVLVAVVTLEGGFEIGVRANFTQQELQVIPVLFLDHFEGRDAARVAGEFHFLNSTLRVS